jgi:hypothetical protein
MTNKLSLIPSDVQVYGTITGRTSGMITTLPNSKNSQASKIGTTIKNHVHWAPDDMDFVSFDFSGLELVIAAAFNSLEHCNREGLALDPMATKAAELVFLGESAKGTDVHTTVSKQIGIPRSTSKTAEYACLPIDYKVLTKTGWVSGPLITENDQVMGYNKNGSLEWATVTKTHYLKNKEIWDFGKFASTPDHRWVAKSRRKNENWGPHTLAEILSHKNWKVRVAAEIAETKSLLTANEAKVLAWLLTDGSFCFNSGQYNSYISQGKEIFKQDIEQLLIEENALSCKYRVKSINLDCWRFNVKHSYVKNLLNKCQQPVKKKIDFNFEQVILKLGIKELKAVCQVICDAEGHKLSKKNSWRIAQNDTLLGQAFRTCFALAGYQVNCNKKYTNASGNIVQNFHVTTRQHFVSDTLAKKLKKSIGDVWCLTTSTDSFLAMSPKGDITVLFNCLYGSGLNGLKSTVRPELPDLTEKDLHIKCSDFMQYFKGDKIKYTQYYKNGLFSHFFNWANDLIAESVPRLPFLGTAITQALRPEAVGKDYRTSRLNWCVQASGGELHDTVLVLVKRKCKAAGFMPQDYRFYGSIHD